MSDSSDSVGRSAWHHGNVEVRRAGAADAAAIARVHIASWHTTYGTLLPPRIVAERTRWDVRSALWAQRLSTDRAVFVACDGDGIFGFAGACAMSELPEDRNPVPQFDAYLESLYLLSDRQRHGVGRALLAAVARDLIANGYHSMALHVLASNPARGFYERLGAVHVRDEPREAGETWTSCAYGFDDIRTLIDVENDAAPARHGSDHAMLLLGNDLSDEAKVDAVMEFYNAHAPEGIRE